MSLLSSICQAIAGLFGWAGQRSAVRNTPAMQAAATAASDSAQAAEATRIVAAAGTEHPEAKALDNLRRAAAE